MALGTELAVQNIELETFVTKIADLQQHFNKLQTRLDRDGNGYADLPGVQDPAVHSWGIIGIEDPARSGYKNIARVAYTLGSHAVSRFVVEGGPPNGAITIRVIHD